MSHDNSGPFAVRFFPHYLCRSKQAMSALLQKLTEETNPELIKIHQANGLEMAMECHGKLNCREIHACLFSVHEATYNNPNYDPNFKY